MIELKNNILLSEYTTFHIGGPAKFFVEVKNTQELKEALQFCRDNKLPFFILGGGSNILASDKGFEGVIIKINLEKLTIDPADFTVQAEAGVALAKIVTDSVEKGLSGFEWAAGIPGTLGGAIRGNAGAYQGEMKEVIFEVTVLDSQSLEIKNFSLAECNFSYRQSVFKETSEFIILSAKLKLKKGKKRESQAKIKEIIQERLGRQPQGQGSAGSFFMNPIVKDENLIAEFEKEKSVQSKEGKLPAAWLIEKAGLKGKKIGGAMIGEKHPNYFINTGQATAEEVEILVSLVKQQVRDKFGVELQEEVQYLG